MSERFSYSLLRCALCYETFDFESRRSCVGSCGHAVCEICKLQMSSATCPRCSRDQAFKHTTINYAFTELLRQMSLRDTVEGNNVGKTEKPDASKLYIPTATTIKAAFETSKQKRAFETPVPNIDKKRKKSSTNGKIKLATI